MSIELSHEYYAFPEIDLDSFRTIDDDEKDWKNRVADLKITTNFSFKEKVEKIALFVLKIILFPWGIYELLKFQLQKAFFKVLYPAQLEPLEQLDATRKKILEIRNQHGVLAKHVRLEKDGISYSALLIGREENLKNGNWVLHASGNRTTVERECINHPNYLDHYLEEGFNVLFVNGPGVGRSDPMESIEQLGEAQELGLCFLETALKANRIAMVGISIGGAAQSLAIEKHHFFKHKSYLVIRSATFDSLAHLGEKLVGQTGSSLVTFLDCNIDSVRASKRLQNLGIYEVIFQSEKDTLLRDVHTIAELAEALKIEGIVKDKAFYEIKGAEHYYSTHNEISLELSKFLARTDGLLYVNSDVERGVQLREEQVPLSFAG